MHDVDCVMLRSGHGLLQQHLQCLTFCIICCLHAMPLHPPLVASLLLLLFCLMLLVLTPPAAPHWLPSLCRPCCSMPFAACAPARSAAQDATAPAALTPSPLSPSDFVALCPLLPETALHVLSSTPHSSPLCPSSLIGCARPQLGKVLVLKRLWTSAM